MRRLLFALSTFYFLLSSVLVVPVYAQGDEFLPAGQTIESDYIRAGNTVQIDGEIKGDAFLAGAIVTVNGKIDGDLFVAGGKVNINGAVGNSIRVLAGDVTVNSGISRNSLLICGNCSVTEQATIGGSLIVAGGNLEVSAPKVGKGFRFFGNRLYLNSEVTNEAFVVADREFILGPKALVTGDLKYTGNSEAVLEQGATVGGSIFYQKQVNDERYPRFFGARTLLQSYQRVKPVAEIVSFLIVALLGFVLLGLFPRSFEKVIRAMERRSYASLGWGILIAIGLPVAALLFTITVIGIPVALVLALIAYLAWLLAQYVTAVFLGRKILLSRFGERRGWALFLGLLIIYLLGWVPVLGNLVKLVLVLFGLGAIALSYRQPVIIEPFDFSQGKQPKSKSLTRGRR